MGDTEGVDSGRWPHGGCEKRRESKNGTRQRGGAPGKPPEEAPVRALCRELPGHGGRRPAPPSRSRERGRRSAGGLEG